MWSPGREQKTKSQLPLDPKDQGAELPGISDLGDFPRMGTPSPSPDYQQGLPVSSSESACLSQFSLPPS